VVPILRTAIVSMTPMLRDIVTKLPAGRVRLDIVADLTTRDHLAERLKSLCPDMVLIELARGETDRIARAVLTAVPRSKVIAFSGGGRNLYIHEMRPHRRALFDVSAQTVTRAMQGLRWTQRVQVSLPQGLDLLVHRTRSTDG
jgi:hypothetical protein